MYQPIEIFLILLLLGLFVAVILLISKYNKKTLERTKATLAKKGLKQERLSCKQAIVNFFAKAFDFKSRAALSELWWIVLCIIFPMNVIEKMWPMVWLFLLLFFIVPLLSLSVRRFRDVGISPVIAISIFFLKPIIEAIGAANFNGMWVLWFFLLGLVCLVVQVWAVFRASDPFDNKFGKIPNVIPLNKKENNPQKTNISITNTLQKIYFKTIKNTGNIRLLFVLGIICSFICLNNVYDSYSWHKLYNNSYSLWNFLWVIFWFYVPFFVVFLIKFIIDGYKQEKKKNTNKK